MGLAEQYPEQTRAWQDGGGADDALRAHLLGIGVLPAGPAEYGFLCARLQANLDQLRTAIERSVAGTSSEPSAPALGREDLVRYARVCAQDAGIDAETFVRQIDVESGFNPRVVSPAGAEGIAQIVRRFHPGVDPLDPLASLRYAARLMRSYLDELGSYELALAAYNAGVGAVREYNGVPPYPETRRYVAAILG